jgi:hypothetical protein
VKTYKKVPAEQRAANCIAKAERYEALAKVQRAQAEAIMATHRASETKKGAKS